MLFTTATCPNCKTAATLLNKAGINYIEIKAEENVELVEKFEINQAPTLIVAKNGKYEKYSNVSNIKKYIG